MKTPMTALSDLRWAIGTAHINKRCVNVAASLRFMTKEKPQ
jgi:hypothetical protein